MEETQKQKISQTDLLIEKLYDELSFLSQKLARLESDKVGKIELSEKLEHHHFLINNLQTQYKKQEISYKKNIKIAMKMMQQIKDPIANVSNSLQKISDKTKELETKKSLNSCLNTLAKLKQQCYDSESYFDILLTEKKFTSKECSLQEIFTALNQHPLYGDLKFSEILSEKIITKKELLQAIFYEIFDFLYQAILPANKVSIVMQKISPDNSLNNQWNTCISFYFQSKEKILWNKDWENSLQYTADEQNKIPLKWLYWKKELNLYQGEFYVEEEENQVEGISLTLPFQYSKSELQNIPT